MITAQRAFDANAQVITTANQSRRPSSTSIALRAMDRGLYVAMTGAKQIMQAQAVNNHNIANITTVGFRADAVSFTSEPIYGAGYPTPRQRGGRRLGHRFLERRTDEHESADSTSPSTARASSRCRVRRQGRPIRGPAICGSRTVRRGHDRAGFPVLSESGPERAARDLRSPSAPTARYRCAARPEPRRAVAGRPHQAGQSADRQTAEGRRRPAAPQERRKAPTDEPSR
jgi:hypothetical protein